jgi:ubiquitin-protein ligase
MNKILVKHVKKITRTIMPNIRVFIDDSNISMLQFVFFYERCSEEEMFPTILPPEYEKNTLTVSGHIDLSDYPVKSPQMMLNGDVPHCHVYKISNGKYKVCHSLDRSFEWYFKNIQTAYFNPTMNLVQYVINMYKFLGSDDKIHSVSTERYLQSYEWWENYSHTNVPEFKMEFNASVKLLDDILTNSIEKNIIDEKFKEQDPDLLYVDFVDSSYLLDNFEDAVIPVVCDNLRGKIRLSVPVVNFTKYNYFYAGIRKTSYGYTFTNCIPAIIDSRRWDLENIFNIFNDQIEDIWENKISPMFTLLDSDSSDFYIYMVLECIVGIIADILKMEKPMRYQIIILSQLFHNLALLKIRFKERFEKIVQSISCNWEDVDEDSLKNILVSSQLWMIIGQDIDQNIFSELFLRMIHRTMFTISSYSQVVKLEDDNFIFEPEFVYYVLEKYKCTAKVLLLLKYFHNFYYSVTLDTFDNKLGYVYVNNIDHILRMSDITLIYKELGIENYKEKMLNAIEIYKESYNYKKMVIKWKYKNTMHGNYHCISYPSSII